jgi:YVTN family beta-propeller protein
MRRNVISSASMLSIGLMTVLSLSAIYSGVGIAKADSVIDTITVGTAPNEVAFDSFNGNLYLTNHVDNTVSVISGQTNTVIGSPITVGSGPVGIAFDSANGDLYVANHGAFRMQGTVSVISGQTNTVIGSPIPVGQNPWDIAFDPINGNLYVTNFSDNTVSVISGQTNTVIGSIPVGTHNTLIQKVLLLTQLMVTYP